MRRSKDVTTARRKGPDAPTHFLFHVLFGAEGQHVLFIHTPMEGKTVTKLLFQFCRIHARSPRLHRVKYLETDLDEIGDERADTATTVKHDLDRGIDLIQVLADRLPASPQTGQEQGAKCLGRV